MTDFIVAEAEELSDGDHLVTEVEGREIGVFNVDGELHAYTNWCAHQSGPICEGYLGGTSDATFDPETLETTQEWVKEGEIITCPWHGWEYDLLSGDCLSKKDVKLPKHTVREESGQIVISL